MKCNFFYLVLIILLETIVFGFILKKIYEIIFCIIVQLIIFAFVKDKHHHDVLYSGTTIINFNTLDNDEKDNFDFCTICLEDEKEDLIKLNCNHIYHKDCIAKWISSNNSCPICRLSVLNI